MRNRRALAFIFAPIVPSVFFLFALHLTDPRLAAFVLLFSTLFSYLPCFVLGRPIVKYLERRNSLSVVNMALCGAFFGTIVFYVFGFVVAALLGSPKSIVPAFGEMLTGALLGISVALPFSLIAGFPLVSAKSRGA